MGTATHCLTGVRAAAAALIDLGAAPVAAGAIARRRPVARLLERTQADQRAVRRLHQLRSEFGRGPVELRLPGRRLLVVTDPEDVQRVLQQAPTPFHPANREKRKALQWFQPHGVLISQGPIRRQRREVNEEVLDADAELHRLAGVFADVVVEAADEIIGAAAARGRLTGEQFMTAWWRLVRRVALGDRARDDEEITDRLLRLRKAGNWSFLSLPHYRARSKFFDRLYSYAEAPEPATLVGAVAETTANLSWVTIADFRGSRCVDLGFCGRLVPH